MFVRRLVSLAFPLLVAPSGALAQTFIASFDDAPPAGPTQEIVENGVRVFLPDPNPLGFTRNLGVEDASALSPLGFGGLPQFTAPNVLGGGGSTYFPSTAYSAIDGFNVAPPAPVRFFSVDVYMIDNFFATPANVVTVEALAGGVVVDSASVLEPALTIPAVHTRLTLFADHIDEVRVRSSGPNNGGNVFAKFDNLRFTAELGAPYCGPAVPNSTGGSGRLHAAGSDEAVDRTLSLVATDLPPGQFGVFLASTMSAPPSGAGGPSNGNLCLGGSIQRLGFAPGLSPAMSVMQSDGSGVLELPLDLDALAVQSGTGPIAAGQTWFFQTWHRDAVGVGSNLTEALELTLR
ncbi:MAG: hypothetical protein AAFU73_13530 [Planctomycetota bacterium]